MQIMLVLYLLASFEWLSPNSVLIDGKCIQEILVNPERYIKKKTCRDLGHLKNYADKINNDPILKTYTKAYKAHYARFMKKRMTQNEFQIWADYALDLRAKAYSKELSFKEYEEAIRVYWSE